MKIRLGDLELTSLMDGYLRLDGGAMFGTVPKTLWQERAPADVRNRITLAMRPLLVRGERLLLVDAGVGDLMDAKRVDIFGIDRRESLDVTLAREGLARQDIDLVLATHLHFDHAGGFTRRESSGALSRRSRAPAIESATANGRTPRIRMSATAPATCRTA